MKKTFFVSTQTNQINWFKQEKLTQPKSKLSLKLATNKSNGSRAPSSSKERTRSLQSSSLERRVTCLTSYQATTSMKLDAQCPSNVQEMVSTCSARRRSSLKFSMVVSSFVLVADSWSLKSSYRPMQNKRCVRKSTKKIKKLPLLRACLPLPHLANPHGTLKEARCSQLWQTLDWLAPQGPSGSQRRS